MSKLEYLEQEEKEAYEQYTAGHISLEEYCEVLHVFARLRGEEA